MQTVTVCLGPLGPLLTTISAHWEVQPSPPSQPALHGLHWTKFLQGGGGEDSNA